MQLKNTDRRMEKGDETSAKILLSAMESISQNGIGGISATKLSELSGVSRSAIFYHFKSMQEIPEAVLKLIFDGLLQPIEAREGDDVTTFLNRVGVSFVEQMGKNLKMYKAFFSFYHESMFDAAYKELMGSFLITSKENLAATIQKLSGAHITETQAATVASLLVATLDGMGMHILLGGDPNVYVAAWQLQIQSISRIIADKT